MAGPIDYILYSERMVGKDSPDYDDTLNRALRTVITLSGLDPDDPTFAGFAPTVHTHDASAIVSGVLPVERGGTGGVSIVAGSILYGTGPSTVAGLPIGSSGQFMRVAAGLPSWHTLATADISDLTSAATGITKLGTVDTGVWQGTSIATTYTDAKIKTVTGTSARIVIGGTATDPTFDISASYAGQASIVTVGTISAGVWNGTAIATAYTVAQLASLTGTSGRITIGGTSTAPTIDIASSYVGQNTIVTVGTVATGTWQATQIANAYIASGLDVSKLTVGTTLPSNVVTSSLTSVGTIASGVWNGSSISTTYTDAKVKTVTGTANRIAIGGTATDPSFDISAAYVGQTSITTLGVVTSGTWSGTTIATTAGGTGLTAYALGDVVFASATNTLARLTGNTTTQLQVLAQTGTGSGSAAPAWHTIAAADIGDLTTAATGITKVGTVITGTWNANVVQPTYGGTGVANSATITLVGAISTAGALTTAGAFTTSGAFPLTLTATASTNVTLPTSGTLVTTTVTSLSSLTTVGVLASPHMTGAVVDSGGLIVTLGGASITGNSGVTGTFDVSGNFAIATSKFTVAAGSGNTVVAGTLNVTGGVTLTTLLTDSNIATISTGGKVSNSATTATAANTASTIVLRDASGNFSAGVITGTTLTGPLAHTLTFGTHLSASGSSFTNAADVTIASDATNANTAGTIVARDGSGNFAAGTITATFTGNLTGNVTGNVSGTAPAGTLTGTTLASNVVTTSITSVGVLAAPHMTAGVVDSGGFTVTGGGVTVTGNSTITGTLGGISTLTATTLGGTLSTAAQPNITSVGILVAPHMTSAVVDSGGFTVTSGTTAVQALTATTLTTSGSGGIVALAGGADVTGNSIFHNALTVGTGLTVSTAGADITGNSIFHNNLSISSGLTVGGDTSIAGALTVTASTGLTTVSFGLQFSTTAPSPLADGQIWYDGSNYKGRLGGVTKTFTVT